MHTVQTPQTGIHFEVSDNQEGQDIKCIDYSEKNLHT